jgi:hypothetical protein
MHAFKHECRYSLLPNKNGITALIFDGIYYQMQFGKIPDATCFIVDFMLLAAFLMRYLF